MSANGWLQFAIYSVILLATVRPVGIYVTRVLEGERTWLDPVSAPSNGSSTSSAASCRQGDELARVRIRHAGLLGRRYGVHIRT